MNDETTFSPWKFQLSFVPSRPVPSRPVPPFPPPPGKRVREERRGIEEEEEEEAAEEGRGSSLELELELVISTITITVSHAVINHRGLIGRLNLRASD